MIDTKNNSPLKSVVVLTNNETKKFEFLQLLGYEDIYQAPTLCAIITPTKVFNYQVFNLLNSDSKLLNYVKSRDGIIILIDQMNDPIVVQITNIINQNMHHPVLVVFEQPKDYPYTLKHLIKSPLHKYIHIKEDSNKLDWHGKFSKMTKDLEIKEWFNDALKKNKSAIHETVTSVTIPIKHMANEFEQCILPLEMWDHYGRLKIVYYSLCTYGFNETINPNGWLCTNWIKYKTSIAHGNLWHYTLTRFWAHVIYKLIPRYRNFHDLYTDNPEIQSGQYFKKFYTDSILFTPYARTNWVPPNLDSI